MASSPRKIVARGRWQTVIVASVTLLAAHWDGMTTAFVLLAFQ
jgi:hypothetical protein